MMVKHGRKSSAPKIILLSLLLLGACSTSDAKRQPQALETHSIEGIEITSPKDGVDEGSIFRVRVKSEAVLKSVSGEFSGKSIVFFPEGPNQWSAFVGVPVIDKSDTLRMKVVAVQETMENEPEKTGERFVDVRINAVDFPAEMLTVQPRKIEPLAKDMPRIKREQAMINKVRAHLTEKKYWSSPLTMPVSDAITSQFGSKRVYNGIKQSAHYGTDLRAKVGTPVRAPMDGKVVIAKNLFFTGWTVMLDHGYGMFSVYGHLSKLKVKTGREVKKGQIMALSGATGRVSGPHLHWGFDIHGMKIDPLKLMNLAPELFESKTESVSLGVR